MNKEKYIKYKIDIHYTTKGYSFLTVQVDCFPRGHIFD